MTTECTPLVDELLIYSKDNPVVGEIDTISITIPESYIPLQGIASSIKAHKTGSNDAECWCFVYIDSDFLCDLWIVEPLESPTVYRKHWIYGTYIFFTWYDVYYSNTLDWLSCADFDIFTAGTHTLTVDYWDLEDTIDSVNIWLLKNSELGGDLNSFGITKFYDL